MFLATPPPDPDPGRIAASWKGARPAEAHLRPRDRPRMALGVGTVVRVLQAPENQPQARRKGPQRRLYGPEPSYQRQQPPPATITPHAEPTTTTATEPVAGGAGGAVGGGAGVELEEDPDNQNPLLGEHREPKQWREKKFLTADADIAGTRAHLSSRGLHNGSTKSRAATRIAST
jgi:hypothetical protein